MQRWSIALLWSCHILRWSSCFSLLKELITWIYFSQVFIRNFVCFLPYPCQIWTFLFSSWENFYWRFLFVFSSFKTWCVNQVRRFTLEIIVIFWRVFCYILSNNFWSYIFIFSLIFSFIKLSFFLNSLSKRWSYFKSRKSSFNIT